MELFTGDLKSLEKEIELTMDQIYRGHNKKRQEELYMTINTLISFYCDLGGSAYNYLRRYNKNKYFCSIGQQRYSQKYSQFEADFFKEFRCS